MDMAFSKSTNSSHDIISDVHGVQIFLVASDASKTGQARL
jgi:hypothetical protein